MWAIPDEICAAATNQPVEFRPCAVHKQRRLHQIASQRKGKCKIVGVIEILLDWRAVSIGPIVTQGGNRQQGLANHTGCNRVEKRTQCVDRDWCHESMRSPEIAVILTRLIV